MKKKDSEVTFWRRIKKNKNNQVNMNVDFNDDSIPHILALLHEKEPLNLDLSMNIDENVFSRSFPMNRESENESDSDDYSDSENDSLSSFSSIENIKPMIETPSMKLRTGKNTKIFPEEKKNHRLKLPFMQRLYEYCMNERNREWIDFYEDGGVWIKNIKKMTDDCLISPLLKIKFTSFRKMLTNYGFTGYRLSGSSSNETVYRHLQFRRDSYEQCLRISPHHEKVKSQEKKEEDDENLYIRKKRGPKRKKAEISDSSSETTVERWSNPPQKRTSLISYKNTFSDLNESLSLLIEKMNKIKSDLESSRFSRTEIRQYQHKIQVIKDILNEC